MELSPKQQAVELIKNSKRILIIGHKKVDGDFLGSALALTKVLTDLNKKTDLVISEAVPEQLQFLPFITSITQDLILTDGKILRVDTEKIPISGMKYQKKDKFLDIILETDKNLKFEFIEIINGSVKPDAIIVLDTPDVEKIDLVYDKNTELFFEVPIINIDHHAGNEYFGSVNLVDLTASSTAEILVSLFEALGIKIAEPNVATCLLTGIISDTQSFRTQSTTPKSLTVAAQLLAAGGRQQEIISSLYKKRPMALMKLWGEMLSGISEDKKHHFAWTKVSLPGGEDSEISAEDVLDASDELLANTPDANVVLVMCEKKPGHVVAKLTGSKESNVLELAKLFNGSGNLRAASFKHQAKDMKEAELQILKKLHDFWSDKNPGSGESVWNVVPEKSKTQNATKSDPIDSALRSISEEQLNKENSLTPLSGIIEKKKQALVPDVQGPEEEIDVFDELGD